MRLFALANTLNPHLLFPFRLYAFSLLSGLFLCTSSKRDISKCHLQNSTLKLLRSLSFPALFFSQLVCTLFGYLAFSTPSLCNVLSNVIGPYLYKPSISVQNVAKTHHQIPTTYSVFRKFEFCFGLQLQPKRKPWDVHLVLKSSVYSFSQKHSRQFLVPPETALFLQCQTAVTHFLHFLFIVRSLATHPVTSFWLQCLSTTPELFYSSHGT